MGGYLARRALVSVAVLAIVSVLVFAMVRLTPGDPAEIMAGSDATPSAVERIRREMMLDRPVWVQYGAWLGRALRGDLGASAATGNPVGPALLACFAATLELTVLAMAIATVAGIALGVLAATRPRTPTDAAVMAGAVAGQSMPVFWLALLLIYVFGVELKWLPIGGRLPLDQYVVPRTGMFLVDTLLAGAWGTFFVAIRHLVLPVLALSAVPLALIARMTRASLLEVLEQDYITTATAKGLSRWAVLFHHALRNALIVVVTVVGINFGALIGGAILTETIFGWPGLGRFIVEAVFKRDYPVIQGGVLLVCASVIAINYALDVLYARLDPRIRYG